MAGDPRVIAEIRRQGRNKPRKHVKSAFATGIVESGLRNLGGGDADSQGWRQERKSIYANPTNIRASVRRYFQEAAQHDHGQSSAQLSADVQRPAAQYRGRYGEHSVQSQAARLLRGGGGTGGGGSASGGRRLSVTGYKPGTTTISREQSFDQEGYETARRRSLVGGLLARSGGTNSILFKSGLLSTEAPNPADFSQSRLVTKTTPGSPTKLTASASGAGAGQASGSLNQAISWAASKVGVKERGANRGPQIDQWQKKFGFSGAAWCGIFTGMALQKAGVRGVGPWIASVAAIEQKAKAKQGPFEGWSSPKGARPGDLVVTRTGGHVELVTAVKNGKIHTVGGNTSDSVARNVHSMASVHGIARVRRRG